MFPMTEENEEYKFQPQPAGSPSAASRPHLPSGVTPLVRDPLVKDQFLLPIWNHLWFYKIKLYAKREEIT